MPTPKVSVIMMSYNSESTIGRAVMSVLTQKTDFPFEVIIVDDDSKDGSWKVLAQCVRGNNVVKYQKKHPCMMHTFLLAQHLCTGDYIAICDCDDYWIDPLKLQMQFNYMGENPDCGLCLTKVYTEKNGQRTPHIVNHNITFDNLLTGKANIHAQSYFIRKSLYDKHIDFKKFLKFHVWDLPIVLELATKTSFVTLDFYSAVFNKGEETVTQTKSRFKRLKYVLGNHKIRLYFILKYGCKLETIAFLAYRLARDIYAVIFKRW